jgi:hypothetical protein
MFDKGGIDMNDIIEPNNNPQVIVPIKSIVQLTPDNTEIYTLQTTDENTHLLWLHGSDFYLALWDLDQWLREQIKYAEGLSQDTYDAYETVRDKIREIMSEHHVDFEMVS